MASTSDAAAFYTTFQQLKAAASDAIAASAPDAASKLAAVRAALAEARPTLPPYDQRSYDLQVRELETRLSSMRAEKPKARFAFSKRAASTSASASASSSPPASASASAVASTSGSRAPTASPVPPSTAAAEPTTTYTLSGTRNGHLTPADYAPAAGSSYTLTLADLEDCIVDLRHGDATLTSLHARGLKRCVVIAPAMSGSAMLSDLTECVVALGAQQFRLHTSTDTVLMLYVASLPVIEQCQRLHFGPYPYPAPDHSRHEQVQDFDWVRSGPSPHWSLLSLNQAQAVRNELQTNPVPSASHIIEAMNNAPPLSSLS